MKELILKILDRIGAKLITGMIGSVCVTIAVCLKPFAVQPTFFEYSAVIGALLGAAGATRVWEKSRKGVYTKTNGTPTGNGG